MAIQRANNGDLLAPGFREIFFQKFGERPPQYTELFNIEKEDNRQYVDDSYMSEFGLIPTKDEGVEMDSDEIIQGFDKRYTFETYALQYRVTEENMEDDLYNVLKKLPASLGRSMRSTVDQDGANMYNDGFDSSVETGGDGKELFATDHPLLDGSTQKNELSVAADLNATSLEQALIDIRATTNDRGLLVHLKPRKLVIAPANEWNARKLLQSQLDPDSANNAINPAQGQLEIVVNDYLTDPDAWFVLCDEHELNWFWRVMPDHMQGNDFGTGDAKFKVRARWKRGWSLPWGAFASPGA